MATEKKKMLAQKPYIPSDEELANDRLFAQ